jgi:cobalamin-dependent methionine synthase I
VRGRLVGLARDWGLGVGPVALLACPPDEQHDIGLLAFGLALRARGWRIVYLGSDTPIGVLGRAASASQPNIIVLSATRAQTLAPALIELEAFAPNHRIALGGHATTSGDLAAPANLLFLTSDPITEAERVATM